MCCGREGSPAPDQPCGAGGGTEIQEMIPVCTNKWGEQRFRGQGKLPSSGLGQEENSEAPFLKGAVNG